MKDETNNTATRAGKTVVRSYKDLLRIIQQSIEQHNEIRLVDLLVTFKVDTYTLLGKKGIPTDISTDTLFVDYPVIIEGLECKEVVLNKITFNKEVSFLFSLNSEIERLAIYDCNFNCTSAYSLRIEELICGEFDMIHCSSNSSISFDGICCSDNFNIEEVEIKGGFSFRNFRLLPKEDTELYLGGSISKDVEFVNCTFFKKTIVNIETEGCIIYQLINYDIKENTDNGSNVLCRGSICMNQTTIGKRLVFHIVISEPLI